MKATLTYDLLTLFPGMARGFLSESMLGRASERGLIDFRLHDIRDWATDKHKVTDDRPFGGGAGMVLKPEPLFSAVEALREAESMVIYMAPDGEPLNTRLAQELATKKHIILISGHYEGIDERVREQLVDREVSIGDYVLTNGTLPACVLADAVSRYVPGVLGEPESLEQDAFYQDNLLSFPQYTRPAEFRGHKVPEVLLNGNHQEISQWRRAHQLERTRSRRPDLMTANN